MKRFLFAICLMLACAPVWAQAPGQILFKDSGGVNRIVSADYPLPTNAVVNVGSVSVAVGTPPDVASQTVYAVGASVVTVTGLANRQNVSIWNLGTETVWVGFGSTPTVGSGVPVYSGGYVSLDLDQSVAVKLISATPSTACVLQTGY